MNLKNKKILVTGGAGFIGSHLVNVLYKQGASITIIDDFLHGCGQPLPDEVKLIKIRLPDSKFSQILKEENPSAIFHLAGTSYVPPSVKYPIEDLKSNAEVTLNILETVRITKPDMPVIYFSSAAVYGNPKKLPINEDDPVDPVSPYGVSKLTAERYVFVYAHIHKMRTASLRLFSVYGQYQKKQVVFDLIDKLHKNPNELFVYGDGSEVRDFVYVEDVVNAALVVLKNGKLEGEVYNVASDYPVSIKKLVKITIGHMNLNPKIVFSGQVRPGDPLRWEADINKIKNIGYKPSITIEDGLKKIITWCQNEKNKKSS